MIINEIVNQFRSNIINKQINIKWGSDDITKTEFYIQEKDTSLFDIDFIDDDEFKQNILKYIGNFYIEQCMQVYLTTNSSDKAKKELEKFYPIEKENVAEYCKKFNKISKYWQISVDIDKIEDNCGWQFLEFVYYNLTDYAIKQLKNELGEIKMQDKYEKILNEFYWDYWHILKDFGLSDFLQLLQLTVLTRYKDINVEEIVSMAYDKFGHTEDRELYKQYIATNQRTGDFNEFTMDEYDNREWYINEAIKWIHRLSIEELRDIIYHHRLRDIQDEEYINNPRYIEQDNGIKWDDKLIDNIINGDKKTKQVIKEISDKYECYIYTAFDDDNDNLSTMDNIIGYNDEYACCIEIFSDLADPNDFKEANFGITDEYIDSIIEIREETLKESAKIEAKYNQYAVKTTTSKWNQGCEFGMAIYVWIPYQ